MKRVILQREIPPDQVVKMLETGRTDLLPRFISKKGRPFSAYLKLDKLGKVGFEFEPRAAGDKKTGGAKPRTSGAKTGGRGKSAGRGASPAR